MRTHRLTYILVAIIVILGLILGAGVFAVVQRIPSVADQVSSLNKITVIISNPASESHYPADAAIPFTVLASSSQPITTLEFWADGKLVDSQPPGNADKPTFFYKTFRSMPHVKGEHLYVARARSADGAIGTSNITRILADDPAGFVLLHTIKPGETLDTISQECDTSPDKIAVQNPGLDPAADLPVDQQIKVPCGTLFPASPDQGLQATQPQTEAPASSPAAPPGKIELWANGLFSPDLTMTSAPSLTTGLDKCTVQLLVKDNSSDEKGFEIWRSGAGSFEKIATLGPNNSASFAYQDNPAGAGQIQYMVSAFNTMGKMPSNIATANLPAGTCGGQANQEFSYANGILTVPAGLELAYLYASLDKGPWQRLPPGEGFFTPSNGKVDLSQYIQPLMDAYPNASLANLKGWGWSNGSLVDLGSLSVKFDHTDLTFCNLDDPGQCTGDMGSTHWVTTGEVPSNALNSERTFEFNANASGIKYILVQVAARPFGTAFQLENPYLVDAFVVEAVQGDGSIYGKFKINFSSYQQPKATNQSSGFVKADDIFQNAAASPYDESLIQTMKASGAGFALQQGLQDPVYYIQVVPWDYNHQAGALSNSVDLTYKPRQPNPPFSIQSTSTPAYDLKIVSYSPEILATDDKWGCVKITAIDEAALRQDLVNYFPLDTGSLIPGSKLKQNVDNAVNEYKARLAAGEVICPAPLPPQESPSFWDYLSDFWTGIVDGWNLLKSSAVQLVVKGLNGVLGPEFCNSQCSDFLLTSLNMTITYFTGIPPTLPSANELLKQGFEYAINLGLSEAGVPCDDSLCTGAIESAAGSMADMLISQKPQPGCNSFEAPLYNKSAMCLPAGLTLQPIAGAVYSAPVVGVQVTRTTTGYQMNQGGSDYSILITATARNDAVAGKSSYYHGPHWFTDETYQNTESVEFPYTITESMQGNLYMPTTLELPDILKTGTGFTIPITLTTPENSGQAWQGAYMYAPLQSAAEAMFNAKGFSNLTSGPLVNTLYQTIHRESYRMLSSPGFSVTFTAQALCYDKAAQGKIPCANAVTRVFTPEEVQALLAQMNGVQP
jgi:hypothetical protein